MQVMGVINIGTINQLKKGNWREILHHYYIHIALATHNMTGALANTTSVTV